MYKGISFTCVFVVFFQAEDGIRDYKVTGVQTCALPIWLHAHRPGTARQPEPAARFPGLNTGTGAAAQWRPMTQDAPSSYATLLAEGNALVARSEEHTSELQSPCNLVCRLLLEKKQKSAHVKNMRPIASHIPCTCSIQPHADVLLHIDVRHVETTHSTYAASETDRDYRTQHVSC